MTPSRHPLESLLAEVPKPQQYIGCEWNSVRPTPGLPDVTLVYPDIYELGMSNYGLAVVRHLLLSAGGLSVRRAYAPGPGMEERLLAGEAPWVCIEDGFRVADSSVIGFGVPCESLFTNVLFLIGLAGIPQRSAERTEEHPVIVAGGGGVSNPLPLSPFVDAFFLGEAEERAGELFLTLTGKGSREQRLAAAAGLPGVWVPALGMRPVTVQKAPRLLPGWAPVRQLVPLAEITHDRAVVEIARGCTRGCRFCQATQLTRPVRERTPQEVLELLESALSATGWEDAGLLSLSFSDYSCLPLLLEGVAQLEQRLGATVSMPSLRPDSFARLSSGTRLSGRITLAPEAGSERLRRKLNKPMEDREILGAVESAFAMGAKGVKLYFMIGLPGEEEDDVEAIASLSERCCEIARSMGRPRKGSVSVALSPFVPKPHTPLQWAPQMDEGEIWRRICRVRALLRNARPVWNDPRTSLVEAVLGLGDGIETPLALEEAVEAGARYDAWSERLRWDVWSSVLERHPLLLDRVRSGLDRGTEPPWAFVRTGATSGFLRREYERFVEGTPTPDCRQSGCNDCGACRPEDRAAPQAGEEKRCAALTLPPAETGVRAVLRVRWGKSGLARFSSHLDMVRMWSRAVRRSGIPAATRGGIVRRARLRFGPALPLGFESTAEVVDILLRGEPCDGSVDALASSLPEGFELLGASVLEAGRPAPDTEAVTAEYMICCGDAARALEVLASSYGVDVERSARGHLRARVILGSASARLDRLLSQAGIPVSLIRRTGLYDASGGHLVPPGHRDEGEDLS